MDIVIHTQVYNGEKTLNRTIESVLCQTHQDLLYYISDNASTDGTADIIADYSRRDRRIIARYNKTNYFHEYHNIIHECCRKYPDGYWAMLDADDEYKPEFIEKMFIFLNKYDLDIAVCGSDFLSEETGSLITRREVQEDLIITGKGFSDHFVQYHDFMLTIWGKLYPMRLLNQCTFDRVVKSASFGGDKALVTEAYSHANRVGILKGTLHNYNYSSSSVSSRYEPHRLDSDITCDEFARELLIKKCGEIIDKNDALLCKVFYVTIISTLNRLLTADLVFNDKLHYLQRYVTDEKIYNLYDRYEIDSEQGKSLRVPALNWLLSQTECRSREGATPAAEIIFRMYTHLKQLVPEDTLEYIVMTNPNAIGYLVSDEYRELPLLKGVGANLAEIFKDTVSSVLKKDTAGALENFLQVSQDVEIEDTDAEAYFQFGLNLCAACDYADGWVYYQKELIRFWVETGHTADAQIKLKDLEDILPEDAEVVILRELIDIQSRNERTRAFNESRAGEKVNTGFNDFINKISRMSETDIFSLILQNFYELDVPGRLRLVNYYTAFPLWGALDPDNGVFDTFYKRAGTLYKHHRDFMLLYERLEDARSKNVLYAILESWISFSEEKLANCSDKGLAEYYHPDIFPYRVGEVLVDIGAYIGDSTADFITMYGNGYKRIYCYEIAEDTFRVLEKNLSGLPNTELRKKAAGAVPGTKYVEYGVDMSAGRIAEFGDHKIDVIRIDDDITEPVTFIKMDIEGAEYNALQGCERQIRENHPRLAISTYHGYDDAFLIPQLIDKIESGYKFYMRYHGWNWVASEFSLLAVRET